MIEAYSRTSLSIGGGDFIVTIGSLLNDTPHKLLGSWDI
jgi:hypothetical protein